MSTTKHYKVFNDKNSYEYDISVLQEEKRTRYVLFRSNSEFWTSPGKEVISAIDDGNGITLSKKVGNKIDYHVFVELHILFSIILVLDQEKGSMSKYKLVEVKDEIIV